MDLRVSALSRASERILDAAGAWTELRSSVSPYSEMVVWDAASRLDADDVLRFSAAEAGEPNLGYIAENIRVQWSLLNSPRMRAVTQLRAGLTALQLDEEAAQLTLSDERRVTCRLLIGADGARSPARTLAGIGQSGWAYDQTAIVAHLKTERPHGQTAWQRFMPNGPIAFLPLADGRVSLVWTTTPERAQVLQSSSASEFARQVAEASDHALGQVVLDSERAGFALGLWHSNQYVQARLALAGDAAHTIHPMAGQGVNLGLLDCASLVEVLAQAEAAGEDPASLRVLRRYERWRRSENALTMSATDGLKRLFGAQDMTLASLRRAGLSLVGRGAPLRRAFARRALGLSGDLPELVKTVSTGVRR
jgi:2-octaprenylphenol hydroxylase